MKTGSCIWTSAVILVASLWTEAEAGSMHRDSSGDAMQRHASRMMSDSVMRFPGMFGRSLGPYIAYSQAPPMTIVNIEVQIPEVDQRPTPPPTPPARSKFWTVRCGVFVELEMSSTMNLMEEERKPCAPHE